MYLRKNIKELEVFTPSIEEQNKTVSILLGCSDEIRIFKEKLKKLHESKKGLIQQLLTGKIRVKVI